MKNNGNNLGFLWLIPAAAVVFGILCITGLLGALPKPVALTLQIIGFGCLGIAVIGVLIIVALIILAIKTSHEKKDANLDDKNEVREIISSKEKEIAKLKSSIAVAKHELRKCEEKLALVKDEPEFESDVRNLMAVRSEHQKMIDEKERLVTELQTEVLQLKHRRDQAVSSMNKSDYILADSSALDNLEKQAQRKEDVSNALQELEGKRMQ